MADFSARGGELRLNQRLKEIELAEDGTVAAYHLVDGSRIEADIYVSAMPGAVRSCLLETDRVYGVNTVAGVVVFLCQGPTSTEFGDLSDTESKILSSDGRLQDGGCHLRVRTRANCWLGLRCTCPSEMILYCMVERFKIDASVYVSAMPGADKNQFLRFLDVSMIGAHQQGMGTYQ